MLDQMRVSQTANFAQPVAGANATASGFGGHSGASNDFAGTIQEPTVDPQGPTSFASIYNKRNMHATVNDNFARVGNSSAQQDLINRQKTMGMQGQMPWGQTGYNYDAGFQRKRF